LPLPDVASAGSAGYDIYAAIDDDVTIMPWKSLIVPTGISISLPPGYEAQIRPRSGLAFKHGITIINTPGTIDSDFTGEIKICLINLSDSGYKISRGMRIAQMIVSKYENIEWTLTDKLTSTDRGDGGFGHSGD
jgi:dUTP pyrophosphatase